MGDAERDGYVLLERQIEAINRFPDDNPNPVMRVSGDGRLIYANPASEPILLAAGLERWATIPAELQARIAAAAAERPPGRLELDVDGGHRTFAITCVDLPDLDVVNLYGQDITGAKVVERFPDRNPNPVLRVGGDGQLIYANAASEPIVRALGLAVGGPLPPDLAAGIASARSGKAEPIEVRGGGRIFALDPVDIPEFGFTNVYGTDVTATRAVDRFPNLNPNPVLRVSRAGELRYANPASAPIVEALGIRVGDLLPEALLARVLAALEADTLDVIEVRAGERTFELLVAAVFEFESINLYGTDVTAARAIAAANDENERLLLSILPPSIAQRLRAGEQLIADRFEAMSVLFADVVNFTPLSARHTAAEIVDLLNRVFLRFDALADEHGLEKIKTIGDAYMVVGGLPPMVEDGADRAADLGLDLIESIAAIGQDVGEELRLRVGLHCGPAVAGVIGRRKFIYDVWGNTVNTASRMESFGVPGRVQVTTSMAERLRDTHVFEPRGVVDVKGIGPTDTWLLVGRRAEGAAVRP